MPPNFLSDTIRSLGHFIFTSMPVDIRAVATSVIEELREGKGIKGYSPGISRTLIIAAILNELERWFKVLIKGGRIQLIKEWKKLSSTLGRKVKVISGKDAVSGIAEDIDDEGMLILRLPSGGLKKISTGDVIMLR